MILDFEAANRTNLVGIFLVHFPKSANVTHFPLTRRRGVWKDELRLKWKTFSTCRCTRLKSLQVTTPNSSVGKTAGPAQYILWSK